MVLIPIDVMDAPLDDSGPEGTFRCKVTKVTIYPEEGVDPQTMQVTGETNDKGKQKYASAQIMFEHEQHESNETPDGSLVGDSFSEMYSMSPHMFNKKRLRQLAEATAIPYNSDGMDLDAMLQVTVDVTRRNKKDSLTGLPKSSVTAVAAVIS